MSNVLGVRFWGPLESYGEGFAGELSRLGYTAGSASHQLRLLAHLSRWLEQEGRGAAVDRRDLVRFVAARRAEGRRLYVSMRGVAPLVDFLDGLGLLEHEEPEVPTGVEQFIGSREEWIPIPDDVGRAIVGYLQRGRPVDALTRHVFIRDKAPHRGLTSEAVSARVWAASRRAGLGEFRAHRLRHTAATAMLAAGAPLTEIGQLLRHRKALTTAVYAKTDVETLRGLARRWPAGEA